MPTASPGKMKALIFRRPDTRLELIELDIPQPGKRQVRIKVEACGVCHSDSFTQVNAFKNIEYPRVPGMRWSAPSRPWGRTWRAGRSGSAWA